MTRAKFRCERVAKVNNSGFGYCEIELQPVTGDTPENKSFFRATPGGNIKLSIVAEATAAQFEPGKFYFVDFTETT